MNNKKESDKGLKSKAYVLAYVIAYITLVPFGLYNAALCRLAYGFFGINSSAFITTFLNSIFILVAIIFLSTRNMQKKKNISFLRIIGIIIVMVYPIIISLAQIFSLFEFKGIAFDISKFSIFNDTYILVNIPLLFAILIVTTEFDLIRKAIK